MQDILILNKKLILFNLNLQNMTLINSLQIGHKEKYLWVFPKSWIIQSIHQDKMEEFKRRVDEIEILWAIYNTIDLILEWNIKLIWDNWIIDDIFYDLETQINLLSENWKKKVSLNIDFYYNDAAPNIQRQFTAMRHILKK